MIRGRNRDGTVHARPDVCLSSMDDFLLRKPPAMDESPRLRPLSRAEARNLDLRAVRELGLPTLVLMENAGRSAARWFLEDWLSQGKGNLTDHKVLILCGPGSNGGDGGVMARWLDLAGVLVRVAWVSGPVPRLPAGDAAIQRDALAKAGFDQQDWVLPEDNAKLAKSLSWCTWVVDALLGTGLTRPIDGAFRTAVEMINDSGKPVYALDLPSGLDADTGEPLGVALRATATATFVAPKLACQYEEAEEYLGEVAVLPIGLPYALLEDYIEED